MGAQITSPTRQAAIRRALIALLAKPGLRPAGKTGKTATAGPDLAALPA